jgi:hypothetical protein
VEAAFADGCIKTCVSDPSETSGAGPADAQAAYATIARQSSGLGLFSADDPKVNLKLKRQHVKVNRQGQFVAHVRVKDNGSRAAHGVVVRISDGHHVVGHTRLHRLRAGHARTLTFRWHATAGRHRLTGVVDPRNRIAESDESDNKLVTHRRG